MSGHNYHHMCGCDACCRVEEAAEARDEAIEALLADPKWLAANKAEADEWCAGTHDGSWYSDVERDLADLHNVEPADLLGSDLLAKLYALAKTAASLRGDRLREMAEAEVDARREAA